jgi:hypothetical protein
LRASIILSNEESLGKYATNRKQFDESIKELNTLGIPREISLQIDETMKHIDSRFPKTEATERAKEEIRSSIASGNVSSIYYDGK